MIRRRLGTLIGAGCLAGLAAAAPATASGGPNDPLFAQQWGLAKVGAPAAWSVSTGRGVAIGIVDTGVSLNHEDLAGKVVASTNCVGSGGAAASCQGSGQDDNGHGTHVAGIAAAITGNGKGVAGMAPDARLVVAKVMNSSGSGNLSDVEAGIQWVVDHGARVVNLSLGSDLPALSGILGGSLGGAVEYAWNHGAVPVLAAGNTNLFGMGSSNYGNADAVVVGATGPNDEVAPYSSPVGNAKWALVAPGGDGQDATGPSCAAPAQPSCIVSTYWTASNPDRGYAYDQGTSMAAPLVSGTLALLLSEGLSPAQAVQTLLGTADHSVSCGSGCAGRLDAARAVASVGGGTARVSGAPGGATPATGRYPSAAGSGGSVSGGAYPAGVAPGLSAPALGVPSPAAPGSTTVSGPTTSAPLRAAVGSTGRSAGAGSGGAALPAGIIAAVALAAVAAGALFRWRPDLVERLRAGAGR